MTRQHKDGFVAIVATFKFWRMLMGAMADSLAAAFATTSNGNGSTVTGAIAGRLNNAKVVAKQPTLK